VLLLRDTKLGFPRPFYTFQGWERRRILVDNERQCRKYDIPRGSFRKKDSDNAVKFGVSQVGTSQVIGGDGSVNDPEESRS
jgi:hypothetical protein